MAATCAYNAPNGRPSQLYEELYNKYNFQTAENTFLFVQSAKFAKEYRSIVEYDKNDEPTVASLERENLIQIENPVSLEGKRQMEHIKSTFAKAGIDVSFEIDEGLDNSAKVKNIDGKPVIVLNPQRVRADVLFHEAGHILVDLVGYESDLVQGAITALKKTQLYKDIERLYRFKFPEATQEQIDKEVLTTAIGQEATELFKDSQVGDWKYFIANLLRKLKQLLGIGDVEVQLLVNQLVTGNITSVLSGQLSVYEQHYTDVTVVNTVFGNEHTFLEKAHADVLTRMAVFERHHSPNELASIEDYIALLNVKSKVEEGLVRDAKKGVIEYLEYMYSETQRIEKMMLKMSHPTQADIDSGDAEVTSKKLREILNYATSFELIEDLRDVVKQAEQNGTAPFFYGYAVADPTMTISSTIENIADRYVAIRRGTKRLAITHLSTQMVKTGKSKYEEAAREKLEREYNSKFRKEREGANADGTIPTNSALLAANRKLFKEKREAWVKSKMTAAYLSSLDIGGKYMNLLQQTIGDIGYLERMLLGGDLVNDEVINIVMEMLDKADYEVQQQVNEKYKEFATLHEEFIKTHGELTPSKRYDLFIANRVVYDLQTDTLTVTSEKSQMMVSKYYAELWEELKKRQEIVRIEIQNTGEYSEETKEAKLELQRFKNRNFVKTKKWVNGKLEVVTVPHSRWLDPKYAALKPDTIEYKLFIALRERIKADDEKLPYWARLSSKVGTNRKTILGRAFDDDGNETEDLEIEKSEFLNYTMYYKLPSVMQEGMLEVVPESGGLLQYAKFRWHRFADFWTNQKRDSVEYGSDDPTAAPAFTLPDSKEGSVLYENINRTLLVHADAHGRERNLIPVNLRRPVSNEEQSWDLPTIVMLNMAMAENYRQKALIMHDLELMRTMIEERSVVDTAQQGFAGMAVKRHKVTEKPKLVSSLDSNSLKLLNSILEHRLYGIKTKSSFKANELTKMLTKYVGAVNLAWNFYSAGTNALAGMSQVLVEASGSQYITIENARKGVAKFMSDMPTMMADLSNLKRESQTNLLSEKFNALSDWEAVTHRFLGDSGLRQMFDNATNSWMQTSGEHMIQNTMMYAVLDTFKVLSVNGKYLKLNKDTDTLEETDNKEEGLTFDAVYDKRDANGNLILRPEVHGVSNGILTQTGTERELAFVVARMIQNMNQQMQGNYAPEKMPELRRHWYGALLLSMRRWLPETVNRRWSGIMTISSKVGDITDEEKFYNRTTGRFEEGYYVTSVRFARIMLLELNRLRWKILSGKGWTEMKNIYSGEKARLTDAEQLNIQKTLYELAYTTTLMAIGHALYYLGKEIDKDDKKTKTALFLMAFYAIRVQKELNFYYNPAEWIAVLQHPTVALKLIKDLQELLFQMSSPFELYKTGSRKGDSKLVKKFADVIPIVRQTERPLEEQLSYLLNVRGK